MRTILITAATSLALLLPGAAFAQGSSSGNNAGGGNATASTSAGATGANEHAGNYATRNLPSQRIVNNSVYGEGAALVISGAGVREVQQALNRLGYQAGTINGNWDRETELAMKNFQGAHGLEPTGNLDISSIAALGLWNNLIGNPLGNGNKALVNNNATGAPPPRGREGGSSGSPSHRG